ncbi:hypothetical protein [Legionella septentrionalis]|uniref:hypothetical protein n=1 Tax=Legionella septentrionalis TaxID=2498109 RepID=UPI000F8C63BB|nr:hypothetical protein [Legionella septentrionalis]RUQ92920.1 hypothetical protein ELY11_11995 [Legionella septentrionalis]
MYEFTLKLNTKEFTEELASQIFEAGCDDALFHADSNGVYLDFSRESTSLEKAISSALTDLRKAGYEAKIQEEEYSSRSLFE